MEGVADPIGQGWQTIWLTLGGTVVYALLDALVLSRNDAFRRGAMPFRIGFLVLIFGVLLGGFAWFAFANNQPDRTNQLLIASYVVRAAGIIALITGLTRMRSRVDP